MTVTRRLAADRNRQQESGPELYAPPDRRVREKLGHVEHAASDAFEGEIGEFVRRDLSRLQQQISETSPATDPPESLDALIGRVAGASIEEIDRVLRALHEVRSHLCNERDRLSHEVARYASLSRMSMTAMKSISDSLKQSKGAPDKG
jgi:hypothetical protein